MRKKNRKRSILVDELRQYTLINNLKRKIQQQNYIINEQSTTIDEFKHNAKVTKINEQQIQIRKLTDENKRLVLIVEDLKKKDKTIGRTSTKKAINCHLKKKSEEELLQLLRKKQNIEKKYISLAVHNDKLNKELISLKVNENAGKKKKCYQDRNNLIIQKNMVEMTTMKEKILDLEAQLQRSQEKTEILNQKVEELEQIMENSGQKSLRIL